MPLYKTLSGQDKQTVRPRKWTYVTFEGVTDIPLSEDGWNLYGVMLRIEWPAVNGPTVLRGRLARWPQTSREDTTGFDDKHPFPGQVRHAHWQHFLKGRDGLSAGFKVWHDGAVPIILDGRQFKWTQL
jgi:hypothetical protein